MAFNTVDIPVRGILVRNILGAHAMARGAAEIGRVHVVDGVLAQIASYEHIAARSSYDKKRHPSKLTVVPT
jgi:hypothetical protein